MFKNFTKIASSTILAAALVSGPISTSANAGQSCWGLEGQALSDCIDQLVKDLSDAANENNHANTGGTLVAKGAGDANDGGRTGKVVLQRVTR